MSMREKIAKSIYERRNGHGAKPWGHQPQSHRDAYLSDADAVLDALMEGDLEALVRQKKFSLQVHKLDNGCWEWRGAIDRRDGYGRFYAGDGKTRGAHQFSFEQHHGPVPHGLVVDHICNNRWCVNPLHLRAISNAANVLRGSGWTAENSRKTHCPQGHAYSDGNTYITPSGARQCRECINYRRRKSRAKQAAMIRAAKEGK